MFRADVPVLESIALLMSVRKHSLSFGRQGQFHRCGNFFPQQRAAFNLFANGLDGTWGGGKKAWR